MIVDKTSTRCTGIQLNTLPVAHFLDPARGPVDMATADMADAPGGVATPVLRGTDEFDRVAYMLKVWYALIAVQVCVACSHRRPWYTCALHS